MKAIIRLSVVLLSILVSLCHQAMAQDVSQEEAPPKKKPQTKEKPPAVVASELIAEGERMFVDEADCVGALELFLHAERVHSSYRALTGISFCQKHLGKYLEAYQTIEKLIALYGDHLSAEQRTRADQLRGEIKKELGIIRIIPPNLKNAHFTLDGGSLEPSSVVGPHLVMPGMHTVVVTRDNFQPLAKQVMVAAGGVVTVEVTLVPTEKKLVVQVKDTPLIRHFPKWIPWATLGAGVALAGTGGLISLSARSDYQEFDRQIKDRAGRMPVPVTADRGLIDGADTKVTIARGLWIVGGAAVVTGVVLAIINQPRKGKLETQAEPTTTMLVLSHDRIGVHVRF